MKRNNDQILIIGGAGYIGSVLARQLLARGEKVRVLDKLIYNNGASIAGLSDHPGFSFINGDFSDDNDLNKALPDVKSVVLLAALVGDPICKKYPELTLKTNYEAPVKLLNKLNNRSIDRFIFTSTCSNYGLIKDDHPADEGSSLNPQSLYAETKVKLEKHILSQLPNFDFSPTILRLSTAFGISERMRFDLSISEFTRELALKHELLVYDENTWRPYCHIQDISETIIRMMEAPAEKVSGQVFNVGSDTNNYTKQMLVDLMSKHIPDAVIKYHSGGSDPRNYKVSFKKLKDTLNWQPRISVNSAVQNLITALHNNLFANAEANVDFYGNYSIEQ